MRNVVLPPTPSPQIYNFGNNEGQSPNLDMLMDNKLNGGATNICMDSQILDVVKHQQLYGEIFAFNPHQQCQSGYQYASSSWEDLQRSKNPYPLDEIEHTTFRKRSIEDIRSLFSVRNMMNVNENGNQRKKSKRRKANSTLQQCHHQSPIIKHQKMPMRRSQKVNDKVTALQKLVSPYGKTDTASVLEEASLYIKLLHQQIQNQMLNKSFSSRKKDGKVLDLQSGGLCLFPISVLKKLSQDHYYYFDFSNNDSVNPIMSNAILKQLG